VTLLTTILSGVPNTLLLSGAALAVGSAGGVPLVLARRSGSAIARVPAMAVIELLRGIPPIVWLFIIFFGVGESVPGLGPFTAAVIGLGAISSAYMAEIYRGGFSAIHRGQWEAAAALGLTPTSRMRTVVGPQVLRVSIPAMATYAVGLLKDSSVAYTIGVSDVMFYANSQSTRLADTSRPYLLAAAVYIVLTIPFAWAARRVEGRLRRRVAR